MKEVNAVSEYILVILFDPESLSRVYPPQPLLQLFNNIFLHGRSSSPAIHGLFVWRDQLFSHSRANLRMMRSIHSPGTSRCQDKRHFRRRPSAGLSPAVISEDA
jgi:hypothetical protein